MSVQYHPKVDFSSSPLARLGSDTRGTVLPISAFISAVPETTQLADYSSAYDFVTRGEGREGGGGAAPHEMFDAPSLINYEVATRLACITDPVV